MNWVVTVSGKFKYWVEAKTKADAEARGWRLHQGSENAKHDGSDRVTDAKQTT